MPVWVLRDTEITQCLTVFTAPPVAESLLTLLLSGLWDLYVR